MPRFKVRRAAYFKGGIDVATAASFGDGTHGTVFSASGLQSMTGVGRVKKDLWLPATAFYCNSASGAGGAMVFSTGSMMCASLTLDVSASVWGGAGSAGTQVSVPVLTPTANIANSPVYAVTTFPVPTDADTSGCVECLVDWTTMGAANATSGCVYVIKASLTYISSSATARTAASTAACCVYNYTAVNTFHETDIGDLPSFASTDKLAILTLASDQTNPADTGGSNIAFLGAKLRYVANKLGSQSSE